MKTQVSVLLVIFAVVHGGLIDGGGLGGLGGYSSIGGSGGLGGYSSIGGSGGLGGYSSIGGSGGLGGYSSIGGSGGLGGYSSIGGSGDLGSYSSIGGSGLAISGKETVVDLIAPPKYEYKYAVQDPHTGDLKEQEESRIGDLTKSQYALAEKDRKISVSRVITKNIPLVAKGGYY